MSFTSATYPPTHRSAPGIRFCPNKCTTAPRRTAPNNKTRWARSKLAKNSAHLATSEASASLKMDLSTLALFSLHTAALFLPLSLTPPPPPPVVCFRSSPSPLSPPRYRISRISATVAGATSACLTNSALALVRLDAALAHASFGRRRAL